MKTAVLLVNLGTPNSPEVSDVRPYLREFLNDPRVIDIPWLSRKLLVNLIIVPFRSPKSSKIYKELWNEKGSPLMYHSVSLCEKLQVQLGDSYHVELAMRYQNPSLEKALENIQKINPSKIIVLPLFPQYASASSGSVFEKVMKLVQHWHVIPSMEFIGQFYDAPGFTDLYAQNALKYNPLSYDHVLFSFHGLPERQLDKVYQQGLCSDKECDQHITDENQYCYKATCYETARRIASKLNIPSDHFTVCFQSRLGRDPWVKPYSDQVIEEKAKQGCKKLLVFSPAFVADCLETTVEIGHEYQDLFVKHGGEKIQLVESLNDQQEWVLFLKNYITKSI